MKKIWNKKEKVRRGREWDSYLTFLWVEVHHYAWEFSVFIISSVRASHILSDQ